MLNKIFSDHKSRMRVCDSMVTESGVTIPMITGQVGVVDQMSGNGYYYHLDFWDKVLANPVVQSQLAAKEVRGTIEHPEDDDEFVCTSYENTSHIVTKAWTQDHQPYATFALLNNPKGNSLKALVDVGATLGVSTRGMGQFGNDEKGKFVDDKDYLFITWDVVKQPNFGDLRMAPVTDSLMNSATFRALADMHQLKDSAYKGYNKENLMNEMAAAISDLQKKFDLLKSL